MTRGIRKCFNFVLRARDSVSHSFNFVFDRIRSDSANDNAAQLPADPGILKRPVMLSLAGLFAAYVSL